jgi:hypothetical protein
MELYESSNSGLDGFPKAQAYIQLNPVCAGLVEFPKDYPYSSAHCGFAVDDAPQAAKAGRLMLLSARLEAVPFHGAAGDGGELPGCSRSRWGFSHEDGRILIQLFITGKSRLLHNRGSARLSAVRKEVLEGQH